MLDTKYNPSLVEKAIIEKQNKNKSFYFNNQMKSKKTFAILLPPPNVTGNLHLGHAWDGYLQDCVIRYNKDFGKQVAWIPGMDHAGIATQSKVETLIYKESAKTKYDLGREKFTEAIWDWKEKYALNIKEQWNKMGLALDYSLEYFTYDKAMNEIVTKAFVELYKQKLIYRDYRLVNWDTKLNTAISDIEISHKETSSKMYFIKYKLYKSESFVEVATTRPETIFADTAVFINPKHKHSHKLKNQKVVNPLTGSVMPLLMDEYVELGFGTGAMKCTPAHDFNDYTLGKKYKLGIISCMNPDGTLNDLAGEFSGMDRILAREKIADKLSKDKLLMKVEQHTNQVAYSERSSSIVEPMLSKQWFFDTKKVAEAILKNQQTKSRINFYPDSFENVLRKWLENIQDWCISRQLWWGHQIPVWYDKKDESKIYCGVTPPKNSRNWRRDEDVLDTWFSSGLLPHAINFLYKKKMPKLDLLVTGYDIIFFWVARMCIFSRKLDKTIPFKAVLVHGLIRDEQNRKMSKSLGNGIDPMEIIDQYGSDSLRWFLLTSSSPGEDLRFNKEKLEASWNFMNKIWNVTRFLQMSFSNRNFKFEFINEYMAKAKIKNPINKWILNHLYDLENQYLKFMDEYQFTVIGNKLYDFAWDKYCSKYIELIKNANDDETYHVATYTLTRLLVLMNPFMPLLSEHLYAIFSPRMISETEFKYKKKIPENTLSVEKLIMLIEYIRGQRKLHNLPRESEIKLITPHHEIALFTKEIKKFVNATIEVKPLPNPSEIISKEIDGKLVTLNINLINEEITKNQSEMVIKELEKLDGEIKRIENMLKNPSFVEKAPKEKVDLEKTKLAQFIEQKEILRKKGKK